VEKTRHCECIAFGKSSSRAFRNTFLGFPPTSRPPTSRPIGPRHKTSMLQTQRMLQRCVRARMHGLGLRRLDFPALHGVRRLYASSAASHLRVNTGSRAHEVAAQPMRYCSFYLYVPLAAPSFVKEQLEAFWLSIGITGRCYLAPEGVNAQLTVPTIHIAEFEEWLRRSSLPFAQAFLNWGVSLPAGAPVAFPALTVTVKRQLVAAEPVPPSNVPDDTTATTGLDLSRPQYLNPHEWNAVLDNAADPPIVVDCRNWYEAELGRFAQAMTLASTTFDAMFEELADKLKGKRDKRILLYCTGGIRCEKVGAFMRQKLGFPRVEQLRGGVVHYAATARSDPAFPSRFLGKIFSFDARIQSSLESERVTEHVLASCHQCGTPFDDTTNCANDACHLLFVQCRSCAQKYHHCCSFDCMAVLQLPESSRATLRHHLGRIGRMRPNHRTQQYQRRVFPGQPILGPTLPMLVDYLESHHSLLVAPACESYCAAHSDPPADSLAVIQSETERTEPRAAHMTTGSWQAAMMGMLVRLCCGMAGSRVRLWC
jgi:UPF0176 protein